MTGLVELVRSLPEIKTSATMVVGVVAILAWLGAGYIRKRWPTVKTERILTQFKDDKERRLALEELVGKRSPIPTKITKEHVLPLIELEYGYRSRVLLLIAFVVTALVAVMIAAMLMQRTAPPSTDVKTGVNTGTGTVVAETVTATSQKTTTTQTIPSPAPRSIDDLVGDVHGGASTNNWPDGTMKALTELAARKTEITPSVRDRLLSEATQGEQEIHVLLVRGGAPPADFATVLRNLIRVHQAIAAVAGETTSWLDTAELIRHKRPLIADEMHLPTRETP